MIKHIVMWRIADGEDKAARAKDIKNNLEALMGKIKELRSIEVGINSMDNEYCSDVVLTAEFDTKEGLEKYQDNPEHKAVGQNYVRPYVKERRVVDFEI